MESSEVEIKNEPVLDLDDNSTNGAPSQSNRKSVENKTEPMDVVFNITEVAEAREVKNEPELLIDDTSNHTPDSATTLRLLRQDVRDLKMMVVTLTKKVDKLLERQSRGQFDDDIDEFEMPYLPCTSVEAIEALNTELKDEQFAKFMARKIRNPSIDQLKNSNKRIKLIFDKLFCLSVISNYYTWSGKTTILPNASGQNLEGKRAFCELVNIRRLISLATQANCKLTDEEVKKGIHEYLKRAAVRETKRSSTAKMVEIKGEFDNV